MWKNDEFLIRKMLLLDLDEVLAIEQVSFITPWSRSSFEQELSGNELTCYLVLVDKNNKQVVGYAGMWVIVDEAHVTNVALLPQYRSKRLGTRLLYTLMQCAKQRGADSMTLEVRRSNDIARRLYEKLGFIQRGVRPGYYEDTREDALIMWRDVL